LYGTSQVILYAETSSFNSSSATDDNNRLPIKYNTDSTTCLNSDAKTSGRVFPTSISDVIKPLTVNQTIALLDSSATSDGIQSVPADTKLGVPYTASVRGERIQIGEVRKEVDHESAVEIADDGLLAGSSSVEQSFCIVQVCPTHSSSPTDCDRFDTRQPAACTAFDFPSSSQSEPRIEADAERTCDAVSSAGDVKTIVAPECALNRGITKSEDSHRRQSLRHTDDREVALRNARSKRSVSESSTFNQLDVDNAAGHGREKKLGHDAVDPLTTVDASVDAELRAIHIGVENLSGHRISDIQLTVSDDRGTASVESVQQAKYMKLP
jgi:hypothetical protein